MALAQDSRYKLRPLGCRPPSRRTCPLHTCLPPQYWATSLGGDHCAAASDPPQPQEVETRGTSCRPSAAQKRWKLRSPDQPRWRLQRPGPPGRGVLHGGGVGPLPMGVFALVHGGVYHVHGGVGYVSRCRPTRPDRNSYVLRLGPNPKRRL
eukprot:scaffold7358_cov66-Phaeocystis_antarctica.AAC.3